MTHAKKKFCCTVQHCYCNMQNLKAACNLLQRIQQFLTHIRKHQHATARSNQNISTRLESITTPVTLFNIIIIINIYVSIYIHSNLSNFMNSILEQIKNIQEVKVAHKANQNGEKFLLADSQRIRR